MRTFSIFAVLAATPAAAHDASLPHAHNEWALPIGLVLIALAGVVAAARARVTAVTGDRHRYLAKGIAARLQ